MSAPIVTRADVRQLLDSPGEDPVLYLQAGVDDEGGPLQLDVWVAAHVNHAKVVVHRHEVVDVIGSAPDTGQVDDYLAVLQPTVDEVAADLL
ncbi:hypothetical protein ACK03K_34040 [[Kitasatospora] papulosa]